MLNSRVRHGRRMRLATLVVTFGLGLTGCGGDDKGAIRPQASPTPDTVKAYCHKALEMATVPKARPELRFSDPEAHKGFLSNYARQLLGLSRAAADLAPAEVKPDVDRLVATLERAATSDVAVLDEKEFTESVRRLHTFDLGRCGWTRSDITGTEYAFAGVPAAVRAGPASFEFRNAGKEAHELVLFRFNDEVTERFLELLRLPGPQALAKVRRLGFAFAGPGSADYAVADLNPGRYAMVCFIPVGDKKVGPPHATRGMVAEFRVR